mmetsp:Transcript_26447/g.37904  ORF Transcript_26447/g.37904 Transcript_26447/m.37904 type:complete len:82 (-) Transcript_26447:428-673(-)
MSYSTAIISSVKKLLYRCYSVRNFIAVLFAALSAGTNGQLSLPLLITDAFRVVRVVDGTKRNDLILSAVVRCTTFCGLAEV